MPNYGQYTSLESKDRFNKRQSDKIKRLFEKSDAIYKLTVTAPDLTVRLDVPVHVYNPNVSGKGQKQFVAHPDHPIVKGSILDYVDSKKYLAITQDSHQEVNDFGKLYRMNVELKWKDSLGVTQSQFGYMVEGIGFQDDDNIIPLTQSKRQVIMQYNTLTDTFYKNQRFILGKKEAFKITDLDNFSEEGLLILKLENVQTVPQDDLPNNIAYNDIVQEQGSVLNGVKFSVPSLSIPKGLTKTVSVYEYVNGVQQSTAFSFATVGLIAGYFTIVSTTSNSITIKCENYFSSGTLKAIKAITLTETSIPISLESIN